MAVITIESRSAQEVVDICSYLGLEAGKVERNYKYKKETIYHTKAVFDPLTMNGNKMVRVTPEQIGVIATVFNAYKTITDEANAKAEAMIVDAKFTVVEQS